MIQRAAMTGAIPIDSHQGQEKELQVREVQTLAHGLKIKKTKDTEYYDACRHFSPQTSLESVFDSHIGFRNASTATYKTHWSKIIQYTFWQIL